MKSRVPFSAPLALAILTLLQSVSAVGRPGPFMVFFDSGSSRLDERAEVILAHFVSSMKEEWPRALIVVEGDADRVGPASANLRLSFARARAVAEFLVGRGLARERLILEGYGEARPLVQTADGIAEPQNRRAAASPRPTISASKHRCDAIH